MKVLMLYKTIDGGVGRVVKALTKELTIMGHTVCWRSREDFMEIYRLWGSIRPIRDYVKYMVEKEGYDIIYTHDWSIAFPLLWPSTLYKENHFCCFHGLQKGFSGFLQSWVASKMGSNLVVVGDQLKEKYDFAHLAYNGVDTTFFKPGRRKRRYIGCILKDTESVYTREMTEGLARERGMEAWILDSVNAIKPENMPHYYQQLDTFVSLPVETAGFNLVWLEAIASGVPMVIGNENGIGPHIPFMEERCTRDWLLNQDKFKWEANARDLVKLWQG